MFGELWNSVKNIFRDEPKEYKPKANADPPPKYDARDPPPSYDSLYPPARAPAPAPAPEAADNGDLSFLSAIPWSHLGGSTNNDPVHHVHSWDQPESNSGYQTVQPASNSDYRTVQPASSSSKAASPARAHDKSKLSSGAIFGIVIGALFLIFAIFWVVCWFGRRIPRVRKSAPRRDIENPPPPPPPPMCDNGIILSGPPPMCKLTGSPPSMGEDGPSGPPPEYKM